MAEEIHVLPLRSATPLSKSKFTHGMQCPRYLWYELRTDARPAEIDAATQARFDTGNEVGEYARQRWDAREVKAGRPEGVRITDDPRLHRQAVAETRAALDAGARVIHEAAFTFEGVKVRVDVLERLVDGTFALNEVKSSGRYSAEKHLLDAAVQTWVCEGSGLTVSRVCLVHINTAYVWQGGPYDLEQLFADEDITEAVRDALPHIPGSVSDLNALVRADHEPDVSPGVDCNKPYPCPYLAVCTAVPAPVEHPISELPGVRRGNGIHRTLTDAGFASLLDLTESDAERLLVRGSSRHDGWFYTWQATVTGERIVLPQCAKWIDRLEYPIYHLDFETISTPLPVIVGTRPFEQTPLQYSIHVERGDGILEHREFLAAADDPNPCGTLIEHMLADLGTSGTILRWSPYERTIITMLVENPRFAAHAEALRAVLDRMLDLADPVQAYVFDKRFHGRWSIKVVYPVLVPEADPATLHDDAGAISYGELEGVAKGDVAAIALFEYLRPETSEARRAEIRKQMLAYCKLDTLAMVRLLRALRVECGAA